MKKTVFFFLLSLFSLQIYSQSHYKLATEIKYDSIYVLDGDYYAVRLNGNWGVIKNNNTVVPLKYDAIDAFGDDVITYIKDGKAGFVSIDGKEITPAKYWLELDFSRVDKSPLNIFSDGSALVYDGEKLRLINKKGEYILGDTIDIISKAGNTVVYRQGVAYGMMNAIGKVTQPAKYMQIETILPSQLYAYIAIRDNMKLYGLIDGKGVQKSLPYYDEVRLMSKNDKLYVKAFLPTTLKQSLYDENGELLFQPMYQSIEPTTVPFYYKVSDNMKNGIIGMDMSLYVPPVYEDAQVMTLDNDTFFVAMNEGVSFILNKKNQLLTHYEGNINGFISYKEDNIIFVADSFLNYGVMSSKDGWLIRPEYDEALGEVKDNIILKKNKKWGAINLNGQVTVPFEYAKVKLSPNNKYVVFYEGKKNSILLDENARMQTFDNVKKIVTYDNYVEYTIKDKRNRLYPNGEKLNTEYKSIGSESEGLMAIQDKNGWTYADAKTMQKVTDKYFDFCTYFTDSQALAVQGNKIIVIDRNFNIIDTLLSSESKNLRNIASMIMLQQRMKKSRIIVGINGKYGIVEINN
ncbi:MAG: WG repeat-containing protein [Bacteroidales bacterium]|nr:WG repeat-containing protein [Bacteroidales bacterium]MBQ9255452.1 WG repeat-containing protein [Bacteroidales bacterium]